MKYHNLKSKKYPIYFIKLIICSLMQFEIIGQLSIENILIRWIKFMSLIHEIDTTLEAVKELIETGNDIDEKISYYFY